MSSCSSGSEIATNTGANVCDDHAKWHIFPVGNYVTGERHFGFPSRYVGVSLLTFDYLGSKLVNLEDLNSTENNS